MSRQKPIWELVSEDNVSSRTPGQTLGLGDFTVLKYVDGTRNAKGHVPQHKVEINDATGELRCSCQAFRFGPKKGESCKHIVKVLAEFANTRP
jgi:hypothetical protein